MSDKREFYTPKPGETIPIPKQHMNLLGSTIPCILALPWPSVCPPRSGPAVARTPSPTQTVLRASVLSCLPAKAAADPDLKHSDRTTIA